MHVTHIFLLSYILQTACEIKVYSRYVLLSLKIIHQARSYMYNDFRIQGCIEGGGRGARIWQIHLYCYNSDVRKPVGAIQFHSKIPL